MTCLVSLSTQGAVTTDHRLGDFYGMCLFLLVLEVKKMVEQSLRMVRFSCGSSSLFSVNFYFFLSLFLNLSLSIFVSFSFFPSFWLSFLSIEKRVLVYPPLFKNTLILPKGPHPYDLIEMSL